LVAEMDLKLVHRAMLKWHLGEEVDPGCLILTADALRDGMVLEI
jgi:hypothetical protein